MPTTNPILAQVPSTLQPVQNPGLAQKLANLPGVSVTDIGPPGPYGAYGTTASKEKDDTAYIQLPDRAFFRPWIYTPGGSAYIFPGGADGIQLTSNAQTGIHHYLGSNAVSVDVIYPDELHIVLTGTFMGKSAIDNLHALRGVILQPSTSENGKMFGLPGIFSNIVWGQVINHQFNHNTGDGSNNLAYSVEFIKTGFGKILKVPTPPQVQPSPYSSAQPKGKSDSRIVVRGSRGESPRAIASRAYGDSSSASVQKLLSINSNILDAAGISAIQRATLIPTGTVLSLR